MKKVNEICKDNEEWIKEKVNKICKKIKDNREKILNDENIEEGIKVYCFLKDELKNGNVSNNLFFQFTFKAFYGLKRGVPESHMSQFMKKYFKLMDEKQNNLKIILKELHKIVKKYQFRKDKFGKYYFSFATKLIHTVDDEKKAPIWDSNVAKATGIESNGASIKLKCKSYEKLKCLYNELMKNKDVEGFISEFRTKFKEAENISEEKTLDFILWSLGREIKRQEKRKG